MTTFTKPVLRELRNQLDAILNSNGIDGYTFEVGNCSYSGGEATFKLKVLIKGGKSVEEQDLEQMAELSNLDTEKVAPLQGMMVKLPEMRPYRELGSVEGLVKTVGCDGYGRPIVTITTRLDGQDVKCIASDAGLDKIAHLAVSKVIRGLRVRIHGVLFYKTPAFLGHIEVDRTELFLAEDELPNIDELIDKEFTGGLSSVEFIKQVRADV